MRDPRTNPQKGDVLRKGADYRTIHSVDGEDRWRWVYWHRGGNLLIDGGSNIDQWQAWASDAEVVTGEG